MKTLQQLAADIRDGLNGVTMALDAIQDGGTISSCAWQARVSVSKVVLAVEQLEARCSASAFADPPGRERDASEMFE